MSETWLQAIMIVGSNMIMMLTIFGVTVSLHNSIRDDMREMQNDRKEFYNRISTLEERSRK